MHDYHELPNSWDVLRNYRSTYYHFTAFWLRAPADEKLIPRWALQRVARLPGGRHGVCDEHAVVCLRAESNVHKFQGVLNL